MKLKFNILLLFTILMSGLTLHGQYADTVCAGDQGIRYSVNRSMNSTNSVFVWTVDGGDFSVYSASGDTIVVNWGNTDGVYKIQVVEISDFGCEGIPIEAKVKILESPMIDLGSNDEICEGEEYVVNVGRGNNSYRWHDGSTDQRYIATESDTLWAEVTNSYGCVAIDSVVLTVNPLPILELGPDTVLCGIEEVELNPGVYGYYTWSTGEISPTITIGEGAKTVWLQVEDDKGCIASDTMLVRRCNYSKLFGEITNAFIPESDNDNKTWHIEKIEQFPNAEIKVYDRWGRLVFASDGGYSNDWNGTDLNGKELPMDAYFYVITINHKDAEPIAGSVTIIR